MRCCSGVNGWPMPTPPSRSASYCCVHRCTVDLLSPIDWHTSRIDSPCSRTILTTCSLQLASNFLGVWLIYSSSLQVVSRSSCACKLDYTTLSLRHKWDNGTRLKAQPRCASGKLPR